MGNRAGGNGSAIQHLVLSADEAESELLASFTAHAVFTGIEHLDDETFLEVLLQRRFLSLLFPVVYDIAIDGLSDPTAIRLVREILREEYPDVTGATPSHREDLVADLRALGATRAQVLAARPTQTTTGVIEETLALMLDAAALLGDLGVLTILRFWGEVLVSVEYGEFWRRMRGSFEAAGVASRFYHPHHHHDGREPLARASPTSSTHSGRLGARLALQLRDEGATEAFSRIEQQLIATRMRLYDQFV
jgi:hypothetical protein